MQIASRARVVAGLLMLAALAVLGVVCVLAVIPPAPRAADAPADEFSADRAFVHVQRIGLREHPAGSAAATEVRDYIVDSLTGLGLDPQVREGIGGTSELGGQYGMADTRNVVVRIPGRAPTGTLILMAHYDSVQVSHGGNDDGAGVSTLLEIARALGTGPAPTNDVILLFTDAEEACLCGAESFVSNDPLAAGRAVVLNVESRGSTGPSVMFETSPGNADLVSVYGSAVEKPVATSLAVEVYRILPNNTDFTPFLDTGRFTGLNSAYIDGSGVYHAPEDTPQSMDRASLQHEGDNALALTRALAAADLAALSVPASGDATYFPALGGLVRYPGWLVWPLAVAALLAVLVAAWSAVRRGVAGPLRLLGGLGLATVPLIAAPLAAQGFWALLVLLRPGYANMLDPWWPGWFRAAVVALVAVVVLAWFGLLRHRIGPWPLIVGAFGLLALLGLVMAAVVPGGSYLAALPALAGALGAAATITWPGFWPRIAASLLAGVVAVTILAPTVYLFFPALGLATGAAAALFAVMLGLALLPVLDLLYPPLPRGSTTPARINSPDMGTVGQESTTSSARLSTPGPAPTGESSAEPEPEPQRHRLWAAVPALAAAAAALVFTGIGLRVDHFDADHPDPAELAYVLDSDTGQARWVSTDAHPGEWVSRYVTAPGTPADTFGLIRGPVTVGPAEPADLPAPRVTIVDDTTSGDTRTLTLKVTPQRPARLVYLGLTGAPVLGATFEGRDVPAGELADGLSVVFHAPPADGVDVTLELGTTGPVDLRVLDGADGLAGLPGFTPRPPGVGIAGSHTSEMTVVGRSYTF
ncbi:M28 family peptidase [Nakamurella sp.]|uniref:M28 family peptidase n=1 Tax=Nakamurella sp. TaxID=1869182 RepID=UPI0037850CBB